MTTFALFTNAQPFTQQSSRLYHQLALTRMQYGKPGPSDSARFSKLQPAVERPLPCEEAAACVRVHPKTVKHMARSGDLPGHFRFGRWFFYV